MSEVPGDGDRLQEHLGEQDRRPDVQVDAPAAETGDLGGEDPEIEVRRPAEGRRVAGRVHVDDVGPDRDVHGGGKAKAPGGGEQAHPAVPGAALLDEAAHRGPEPEAVAVALDDRPVDLLPRLPRHPERAVPEAGLHVLGGVPADGQLEVVDDTSPVHGEAGHEAALHQVDEHGGEADLDDVGPDPPQDRPATVAAAENVGGETAQGVAGELPGQRLEERAHPRAGLRRAPEVVEGDLALSAGQRVGGDALEGNRLRGTPGWASRHQSANASSTIWQSTWTTIACTSWMRAVSWWGTSIR